MLERDDRLSPPSEGVFDKHVLSYHWEGFVPHLVYYDLSSREVGELSLATLAMSVSEDGHCVGRFDGEQYRPCPHRRRVGAFSTCKECSADWLPVQKCVFEPQCDGTMCDHPEFCGRKHYVYLASFGRLIKVGMTSAGRLRERAVEQGADAVRPLFECRNRQEARALEKETSRRFKIPQEIRIERIVRQWTGRPVDEEMANVQESYLRRIARWREPVEAELLYLRDYPVHERPRTPPRTVGTAGTHRGEVLGVKGRYMVFRPAGRGEARLLDLSDLVTRRIGLLEEQVAGDGA